MAACSRAPIITKSIQQKRARSLLYYFFQRLSSHRPQRGSRPPHPPKRLSPQRSFRAITPKEAQSQSPTPEPSPNRGSRATPTTVQKVALATTGILVQKTDIPSEWTKMGEPNYYMLTNPNDIHGARTLMTVEDFLSEMSQYD